MKTIFSFAEVPRDAIFLLGKTKRFLAISERTGFVYSLGPFDGADAWRRNQFDRQRVAEYLRTRRHTTWEEVAKSLGLSDELFVAEGL